MKIELSAEKLIAALRVPQAPRRPTIYELLGEDLFDRLGIEYMSSIDVEVGEKTANIHEWRSDGIGEERYRVHLGHARDRTGEEWFVRDFPEPYPTGKGFHREIEEGLWRETLSAQHRVEAANLRTRVIETFRSHFNFRDLQSIP